MLLASLSSMTITTTGTAPRLSALQQYDQAVTTLRPTAERWMQIADALRAEASGLTGCQRTKRIDRALDCESRALARRTADAFRAGAL